ncbi:RodZ family helix-turn-helix domain-containing protein [Cyanobium sp. CH-040]|uniref:helix-turn-helix domain-containing protein n=1 Tax=Cyanobium sp. CH-040 TaxID=2823708 RepID=UPI0020CE4574|nr:helix-turn-helix transcriptional regulator [Cyanobium sp. CH-040]MCP9926566.1 helix-turn-helix domain-containing protein [Cyanobium sp. CH-040]
MAGPGPRALSRIPARLRLPLSRLWRRRGDSPAADEAAAVPVDPLLAAGQLLRQHREQHQLSLRQLADETRISTAVLEALERGWRDRLPEPTYLRTMLPLIERHLQLEAGSLEAVLPRETGAGPGGTQRGGLLRRFTPGSIDVFTTWQGTVLYGLLTLGLIYGLNLQQQRLARAGLLAVAPVPPRAAAAGGACPEGSVPGGQENPTRRPEQALLQAYPELRPLEQASAGQALRLWRQASSP